MIADLRPALALMTAQAAGRAVSPPGTPAAPSLNTTFGAIAIGTFVGLALYGLFLNQATHYFRKYTKDPLITKCIIAFLLVLNTFHSICCMHASYHYGVKNFFNPKALYYGVWSIQILTPISGTIMLISQAFYYPRIYLLGRGYVYALIPLALSMAATAGFVVAASGEVFMPDTFSQVKHYTWLISAGLAFALATDVMLCVTLFVSLISSGSVVWRKHSALTIFLVCTVNTGLMTSALTLLALIFSVIYRNNFVFVAVSMLATKSYANTVLSVVNSRRIHVQSTSQTAGFGAFGLTAQITSHRGAVRGGVLPTPRKDVLELQWRLPSAMGGESDGDTFRGTDKGKSTPTPTPTPTPRGRAVGHEHERDSTWRPESEYDSGAREWNLRADHDHDHSDGSSSSDRV